MRVVVIQVEHELRGIAGLGLDVESCGRCGKR
jgi:hypothetical protein